MYFFNVLFLSSSPSLISSKAAVMASSLLTSSLRIGPPLEQKRREESLEGIEIGEPEGSLAEKKLILAVTAATPTDDG